MTFHFAYCADSSSSQQLSIEEGRVIWANTISGVMWFWGATWEAIRDWGRWEHKVGFVSFGFVNYIETCRVLSHFNFLSMSKGLMKIFLCIAGSGARLPAVHNNYYFRDIWIKSDQHPFFWGIEDVCLDKLVLLFNITFLPILLLSILLWTGRLFEISLIFVSKCLLVDCLPQ